MKVVLQTLLFVCFTMSFSFAQTVWTGNANSDWQDSANWSSGVPTSGMTITIPGTPSGGNFPTFSGGPIIDYTIQNAGELTFNSLVYNNGTIINFGGGTIHCDGQFFNAGMGMFDNDGDLNVNGEFINYGTFDHAFSGVVTVAAGATYAHEGVFFKTAGPFVNYGTTNNSSNMRCTNVFENHGTLNNYNSYEAPFGSVFNNHSGAVISNPSGSLFVVNGQFTNNAPFTNGGEFQIQTATVGINTVTITNTGMFDVSGSLVNDATIINNDMLEIKDGGTLTNNGTVSNNGTITLSICGTLIQNGGNNISAPVLNDGLIFLLDGTVDWNNLEFGNEFTDLSETKPPVAGCLPGVFISLDETGNASIQASQVDKGSYGSCGTSLASVTVSQTSFTTTDLGSNLVTLTIVDNLGKSSSCDAIVTILPYVAPILPIDDADIDFDCPDNITVSTLPGASSAPASWTAPTDVTTTCVGNTECVSRQATNTTQCVSGLDYGFYLKLEGVNNLYTITNGTLAEFEDGTALYTASATNISNADYTFDLSFNLAGRTFTAPGTPKDNLCISVNNSQWYFYTETTGTAYGTGLLAGASISFIRIGEAFQLGNGANATDGTNSFGASGWLDGSIDSQPSNGPILTRHINSNPQFADINIMLSGDGNECRPVTQCSAQEAIPGFVFMGEFNDSKYYCSNSNNYTWAEAKALTEANGGHLAIANNAAENNFIAANILADYAWLGLTDEVNEGTFIDVFGNTPSYFNWNDGEPNNSGGIEDYVRILKSNSKWTDRNEHFEAEVVMEIPCTNSANCEDVTVQITFDNYPEDISWELLNASGDVVISGGSYGNEPNLSTITETTCLTDGCFDFVIHDSYGDGLCCTYGTGAYSVISADGNVLVSGAEFTASETSNFCITTSNNGGNGPVNPPVITQISGPQSGDNFAVGVTEVAYEVTDDCGNQEICLFEVTVDQTPSEITFNNCPGDITINTLPGATSAPVTWGNITASTTCYNDGLVVEKVLGPNIGDIVRVKDGPQGISYNAIDSCGNFANCFFSVTVVATPSSITMAGCSGDIDIEAQPNETSVAASWNDPTGTTDCFTGVVNVTQLEGPASGSDFAVGTSTRIIYLVSDECGNTEICIFFVNINEPPCPANGTPCDDNDNTTINDVEDGNCNCVGTPAVLDITCSGDINENSAPGVGSTSVTFPNPVVSGDCPSGFTLTQTAGPASGDLFPTGLTTVTFEASDACGNTETCSFEVFVVASASTVTITCPTDITVTAAQGETTVNTITFALPTASSDCAIGVVAVAIENGPGGTGGFPFPIGTTTSEFVAADECGGLAYCSINVTVLPFSCAIDADGDGICAADDCDDNDPNLPAAQGTACDDADPNTENDVIGADGCSCAGTPIDPCANAGGDADGDGICAADDCDDNDPNLPAAQGTACDDADPNTENDVIGADGCSCAGTPIDPCAAAGGDADGDGICAADDCDDNDPNLPAAQGTACDDADPNTENDVIGADGCSCAGTPIDPCAAAGGDADGDGICAADDCDDNDPNLPAAQGTACDDADPNTENDVIGADGCSCAGTPIDPCANAGGDADGDGICAADDCDDNDANLPAAQGTACDDADPNTENDVIGADGCSCAGTPIDNNPDCADIVIQATAGQISVDGLNAPVTSIQIFNSSWGEEFKCFANCDAPSQIVSGLAPGTYFVKVALYTASYQLICAVEDFYNIPEGDPCDIAGGDADGDGVCAADDCDDNDASLPAAPGSTCDDGDALTEYDVYGADGCSCAGVPIGTDPCEALGGDADGDGVCAANDCDDNDATLPAAVGSSCDDGDATTENDVYGADGCTCAGTPISTDPDCEDITITLSSGQIMIGGLTAPITSVQVFNGSWGEEFKCFANCDAPNQTVTGLAPGTYFVKVAFYTASYQLICAVEDYYQVPDGDPCENAGGDADGDGICAADDCDDNNANLPAAPGSTCDDGDALTEYDVYGADGCSCAGVPIGTDPCEALGGDADGDGVCAANDCDDNDATLPAAVGSSCDDGDATTENDVYGADGCTCAGTPISTDPDCEDITITLSSGQIMIGGLTAPITSVQVFNGSWGEEFKCFANCDAPNQTVTGLAPGTYFVKVAFYTASYQLICAVEDYYQVPDGDPCENAGGDADGDGICAADDCDDNDANLPAAPGSTCDDGDALTEYDVYGADGCSCAGIPIGTDPCEALGGDADGDGICAANDCDDTDANLPATPGTSCDDGDIMTENDVYGADGCGCAGTPISTNPNCSDITISPSPNQIEVGGLTADIVSIQVFNSKWIEEFKCFANCDAPVQIVDGLSDGTYFVKVAFYSSSYQLICAIEDFYEVPGAANRKVFELAARKQHRDVALVWANNEAQEVDFFVIEKSLDGINFEYLDQVDNTINAEGTFQYYGMDKNPVEGMNYYRLKMVKYDATYRLTSSEEIYFHPTVNKFDLYPNPTMDNAFVVLKNHQGLSGTVSVYNTFGKLMIQKEMETLTDEPIEINTQNLRAGTYMVSVKVGSKKIITERLIVLAK